MPGVERAKERAARPPALSEEAQQTLLRALGAGLFILLIWLGSIPELTVPVGQYHVPITLQTLAVVLAAVFLGPRVGMVSVGGYLLLGLIGWPVFADAEFGIAAFYGQTGGYLIGFLLCQPVITSLIRRRDGTIRGWGAMILAMLAGHAVIFAIGVPWLWAARRFWLEDPLITWGQAVYHGCLIFVPFMLVKTALAVMIGRMAAPWASRRIW